MWSMGGGSRTVKVLQGVMLCWLLGWYIKCYFFLPYFLEVTFRVPVHHRLFPAFFENPLVSTICYLLPLISVPAILRPGRRRMIFTTALMAVCSFILMGHINTYNDATFVTSFWVALWMLFVAWRYDVAERETAEQACPIASWMMGVIFLAGAVGKLTPEYLSGEAFFRIFWPDNVTWPHSWLLATYSKSQLATISFYMSRIIIGMELFLAGMPFYGSRHKYWVAPVILVCFTITNTWAILSVLSCLIGMMLGCWFLSGRKATADA